MPDSPEKSVTVVRVKHILNKIHTISYIQNTYNFTNNYQFTTRMQLNNMNVEVVSQAKLLGTHITNDLKWNKNTHELVKKGNARMQLLRKIKSFNAPMEDLKQIYITFIRSCLEQSCTVWNSMISQENSEDLERIQKCALKIIFEDKYLDYQNALNKIDLETLSERRETLCRSFARKGVSNVKIKKHFRINSKKHKMNTRYPEIYEVDFAHTERLKKSPIIYMQNLLNTE